MYFIPNEEDEHHGGYSLPAKRYVRGETANYCDDINNDYGEECEYTEEEDD